MISWISVPTCLGTFHVASREGAVVETSLPEGVAGAAERFARRLAGRWPGEPVRKEPHEAVLLLAARELHEWAEGRRDRFTVPVRPQGTIFQERVWRELAAIPYGEVRSYLDVAEAIGKPGASRAVGQANHRNPVAPFVPCHRVVTAGGKLGGYGGGVELKRRMLALEGVALEGAEQRSFR